MLQHAAIMRPNPAQARVGITQAAELQATPWNPERKGSEGEVLDVRRPPGNEDDGVVAPDYSSVHEHLPWTPEMLGFRRLGVGK